MLLLAHDQRLGEVSSSLARGSSRIGAPSTLTNAVQAHVCLPLARSWLGRKTWND